MDEARRVIDRLDRIDELKRSGAAAPVLLGEVRRLLRESEDWLAVERAAGGRIGGLERAATDALEDCLVRSASAIAEGRKALAPASTAEEVVAAEAGYDR